jgi:uncharacterized membrane protein required for colicin V production
LVDFLVILFAVISVYRGWRSGLLKSAFTLIGFVGGGLGGLIAGIHYLSGIHNIFGKFALYILFISIGSTLGEAIFSRAGQGFHDKVMFAPIKFLDSILGAVFELLKAAIATYLLFSLILAAHWQWPAKYINESQIYTKAKSVVPGFIKSEAQKLKF